jgi:hypothetical protein
MPHFPHADQLSGILTPDERAELDRLVTHLTPDQCRRLEEMFLSGEITIAESAETHDL